MDRKLIWTETASRQMWEMLTFLDEHDAKKASEKLYSNIQKKIGILLNYPEIGRFLKGRKTIQYYPIDPSHRIYYRVRGNTLIISAFFNLKQDLSKRPF